MKQRVLTWAAVAFMVLAILLAIESGSTVDPLPVPMMALGSMAFGIISIAGVWATGLPKAEDRS